MTALQLPTRPYCEQPCPEYNLSKIVDQSGNNAGLSSFVDAMAAKAQAHPSVSFFTNSEVGRLESVAGDFRVVLSNGTSLTASQVILNIPQQPLLALLRRSPSLTAMADDPSRLRMLHAVKGGPSTKLYVLYEDAWWINELGLSYGFFNNSAVPPLYNSGQAIPQFPPLSGRYHDGHVQCAQDQCRGFLEAVYAYDDISLAFFRPYLADAGSPVHVFDYGHDWESTQLLELLHTELVRLHATALQAKGAYNRTLALRPSVAVLSVWDRLATGFGAGIHDWARDARTESTCHSFSQCLTIMPQQVLQPLGKAVPVFVVNEAFGTRSGWCEGSLVVAENVLHSHFALSRPPWIDAKVYDDDVLFNNTH